MNGKSVGNMPFGSQTLYLFFPNLQEPKISTSWKTGLCFWYGRLRTHWVGLTCTWFPSANSESNSRWVTRPINHWQICYHGCISINYWWLSWERATFINVPDTRQRSSKNGFNISPNNAMMMSAQTLTFHLFSVAPNWNPFPRCVLHQKPPNLLYLFHRPF